MPVVARSAWRACVRRGHCDIEGAAIARESWAGSIGSTSSDRGSAIGARFSARQFARRTVIRSSKSGLCRQGGYGAGAQQGSPPSNARIAPVFARQTNHSAPFAPLGDATRPKIVG